jgi:hypothetical protein
MRFYRCTLATIDSDTDVCIRCGIARPQYRDGGNSECAPRHIVASVTTIDVPPRRMDAAALRPLRFAATTPVGECDRLRLGDDLLGDGRSVGGLIILEPSSNSHGGAQISGVTGKISRRSDPHRV